MTANTLRNNIFTSKSRWNSQIQGNANFKLTLFSIHFLLLLIQGPLSLDNANRPETPLYKEPKKRVKE